MSVTLRSVTMSAALAIEPLGAVLAASVALCYGIARFMADIATFAIIWLLADIATFDL